MQFENTQACAQRLDREHLGVCRRQQFIIPAHQNTEAIYFLGNSLGLQPKQTERLIQDVLQQWAQYGVEGFFKGQQPWLQYHAQLTKTLAHIVGALPSEVVIMNQLTVNLHLMLISFYQPQAKRRKIICEAKAFPSDQYMLQTHLQQRGLNPEEIIIKIQPRPGESLITEEDIITAIEKNKDELALVFWGGVNYYTGQLFNLQAITSAAHAAGAKAGFDLAHAAGNVALHLHQWNVDFACWCSYKYLNSGPGAVGGAFIHQRYHTDVSLNRFAGWWGNKKATQFLMDRNFDPEPTAEGWQLSTPPLTLFAAHKASLQIFEEAGVEKVFEQNQRLNNYLRFVLDEVMKNIPPSTMNILTPGVANEKGCQVSMTVTNGKKVFDELTAKGVFADWREPNVIRIAPVGLYNTFEEVWLFAQLLTRAINKFNP